jgi:hypothetical protein
VKPFVINKHGRLVFPANFLGELDFSVLEGLDQFTAVIGRDFEAKAPTGTDILARVEAGYYPGRFELLRDLGQNLFWVNRNAPAEAVAPVAPYPPVQVREEFRIQPKLEALAIVRGDHPPDPRLRTRLRGRCGRRVRRPYLIDAVRRGMRRVLSERASPDGRLRRP